MVEPKQVNEWIKGTDDDVTRNEMNMPVEGSSWYLIPVSFFESWKVEHRIESGAPEGDLVIDNSQFLDSDESVLSLKSEIVLKPGLRLSVDYELVPPKAWEYFKSAYTVVDDLEIERKSIAINESETQVEVTLKPVQVAFVDGGGKLIFDNPRTLYISHKATVDALLTKLTSILLELGKKTSKELIKLYEFQPNFTFDEIKDKFPMKVSTLLPVKTLDSSKTVEENEIADDDTLLVALKSSYYPWFIAEATVLTPGECANCKTYSKFGKNCSCSQKFYCSSTCCDKGKAIHSCVKTQSTPVYTMNRYNQPIASSSPVQSASSKKGRVGLQNLGNTCFMNSGLQCLSNTTFITEFLLSNRYLEDLNESNPLGTGGRLVREYTALLKELWYGSSNSISPWRFKSALSQFAHQFSGYQQHDSQEMLSFLLDGLHEDLNRVKNKPCTGELDLEGLTEDAMAAKFWDNHLLRNQSVIVDNMHGQYRSEVTCPNCGKTSLTFDPFLMVTLQIPGHDKTQVNIQFVSREGKARKVSLSIPETGGIRAVREAVTEEIGSSRVLIASVSSNTTVEKVYEDGEPYSRYRSLYAFELPEISPDETLVVLHLYKQYSLSSSISKSSLSYPRLLVVQKNAPIQSLYFTIFELFREIFDEDATFETSFPRFHNNDGINAFTLKRVNPHKNYSSYYATKYCPFCQKSSCVNCEVPQTGENVEWHVSRADGPLKLEVIFSNKLDYKKLASLDKSEIAPATHHSTQRLSIYDCLTCSSQREQLDEMNTTYCSQCKDHVRGFKKMDLYKLNKYLIFHIKRFKQEGYFTTRNSQLIDFPVRGLDMSQHSITPAGVYDLYAVSNHYGSLGGGHYTAFAFNQGEWFDYNDSHVSRARGESELVSEASYVLFYKLREE